MPLAALERDALVVALITHEDNPAEKSGPDPRRRRGAKDIPVHSPRHANTPEELARIALLAPDLILSVYYRNMISPQILALPRLGAFNMHGSLLPNYRGRPDQLGRAARRVRVGMTLHRMVKKADAGAIVDQEGVAIGPRDTRGAGFPQGPAVRPRVLARQLDALLTGTAKETPQDDAQATYFGGRKPEDGRVNWTQSSRQIFNLIRAVTDPYPGAFTDVGGGRLMLWWAEPDSPATAAAVAGRAKSFPSIRSSSPAGDGALEFTRTEWRGAPPV